MGATLRTLGKTAGNTNGIAGMNILDTILHSSSRLIKVALLLAAGLLCGLLMWIFATRTELYQQLYRIAETANAPPEVYRWLKGPWLWMTAFPATFWFLSLWVRSLLSFRNPLKMLGVLCLTGLISLLLMLIPYFIRLATNRTSGNQPRMMRAANPEHDLWFEPDGRPVLYYSQETDGRTRYWKDRGYTPDTRVKTNPVTRDLRAKYEEEKRDRLLRQKRLEAEQNAREAERQRILEQKRNEEAERNRRKQEERRRVQALADERARKARERHAERTRKEREKTSFQHAWTPYSISSGMTMDLPVPPGHEWMQIRNGSRIGLSVDNGFERYLGRGEHTIRLSQATTLSIRSRRGEPFSVMIRFVTEAQRKRYLTSNSSGHLP